MREVLEQLHAHRSGVTDGVGQINGEHSRARDARRSNETVEQHRTKRDVSQVGTESGQGHPPEPVDGAGIEQHRARAQQHHSAGHDRERAD